jgi:hypothetical protein
MSGLLRNCAHETDRRRALSAAILLLLHPANRYFGGHPKCQQPLSRGKMLMKEMWAVLAALPPGGGLGAAGTVNYESGYHHSWSGF